MRGGPINHRISQSPTAFGFVRRAHTSSNQSPTARADPTTFNLARRPRSVDGSSQASLTITPTLLPARALNVAFSLARRRPPCISQYSKFEIRNPSPRAPATRLTPHIHIHTHTH